MIEIKKSGSTGTPIYKTVGEISGQIQNLNTSPLTILVNPGAVVLPINWVFSFGDDVTGSIDNNFYLIAQTFNPLSISNINNALVCFNVGGAPIIVGGGIYSGINTRPTATNLPGDIMLTQLTDQINTWQFIKYVIYYTIIDFKDLLP